MLERGLDIPPPISKENADEYFAVLAEKEANKNAEKWIEKHSSKVSQYDSDDSLNNIIPVIKPPPNLFGVFISQLLLFFPLLVVLGFNLVLAFITCTLFSIGMYVFAVDNYNGKIKNYNLGSNSRKEKGWVGDVILFSLVLLIILFLLFIWFVIWLTENLTMSTM